MSTILEPGASWWTLVLIVIVFGFAPGFCLRLIVLAYPRSDPRRAELLAELRAVPRVQQPLWVAEQLEVALFEGLRHRISAAPRTPSPVEEPEGETKVTGPRQHLVAPTAWDEPEMKRALVDRDISSVYRLLRRVGISQRQIAALTGQSESEVSEILKGRQVMAYEVLARIADGLGIPREYMGLAYDEATATRVIGPPDDALAAVDESVKRRKLLAYGRALLFGTPVFGATKREWLPSTPLVSATSHIGMTDVEQVEAVTRTMRALDYQFDCVHPAAMVDQLLYVKSLLLAPGRDLASQRLLRPRTDPANFAGMKDSTVRGGQGSFGGSVCPSCSGTILIIHSGAMCPAWSVSVGVTPRRRHCP